MRNVHKSQVMPYTAEQMFALVADVGAYPEFLPWCAKSHLGAVNQEWVEAELVIAKGPIRLAFATRNQLIPSSRIEMMLTRGPFKQLSGAWVFEPVADGCRVTLSLNFEFNQRLLAMTVGAVFEQLLTSLVGAFSTRAQQLYG